jgi:hypothetical protein
MCFNKKIKLSCGCKIDKRKIFCLPSVSEYEQTIEVIIDECVKSLSATPDKIKQVLSNITIEWWNDIAPRPSTGELSTVVVDNDVVYSGLTIGNLCKVAWRGKLSRSAFAHEILHVIGRVILSDENANHQNTLLLNLEISINQKLTDKNL